jgi:hypothetical protein
MGIADAIAGVLAAYGPVGMAAALYLIFLIDAAVFPALPEVWVAFFFPQSALFGWEPLPWAVFLLVMAVAGEATGNTLLYLAVRQFVKRGRWPRLLERLMRSWMRFLIVKDERIILINRLAPVVPMVGSFMAVLRWNYAKSLAYIVIGAAAKYSALMLLMGIFFIAYDRELAQWITIVLVFVVVGASVGGSFLYRRKMMRMIAAGAVPAEFPGGPPDPAPPPRR